MKLANFINFHVSSIRQFYEVTDCEILKAFNDNESYKTSLLNKIARVCVKIQNYPIKHGVDLMKRGIELEELRCKSIISLFFIVAHS